MNGFQWRGAIDRLSTHRRCIALDFIGLGYSEAPAGTDVSPQAQANLVAAFLDKMAIAAIDIVANNSGGTIAQLFVAQHPERVRSLLLTNCDVHENSPPPAFLPTIDAARRGVLAERFVCRALADPARARSSLGAFYTDAENLTDECIEVYLRPLVGSKRRIDQFHAYSSAFLPNPLVAIEPALRRCQAPARMVWGTGAPDFDVAWAYWLDRTLPCSRGVREVGGANLFFAEERPDPLLEFAETFGAVIVEDGYDGEFRLQGGPLDALQTLDRGQSAFYVGTFSKSVFPALRLGFIVAPPWARQALIAAKQAADGHCPVLPQDALAAFIAEGHLARHVRKMRKVYAERHSVLLEALARHCSESLRVIPAMTGLHLAAELIGPLKASDIAGGAADASIRVDTLDRYAHRKSAQTGLVFGFGMIEVEDIDPALRRLGRLLAP